MKLFLSASMVLSMFFVLNQARAMTPVTSDGNEIAHVVCGVVSDADYSNRPYIKTESKLADLIASATAGGFTKVVSVVGVPGRAGSANTVCVTTQHF